MSTEPLILSRSEAPPSVLRFLFLRLVLRAFPQQWGQLVAALVSIALVVAAALAVFSSARAAVNAFGGSVDSLEFGQNAREIRHRGGAFSERSMQEWLPLLSERFHLAPLFERSVSLPAAPDGVSQSLRLVGDDRPRERNAPVELSPGLRDAFSASPERFEPVLPRSLYAAMQRGVVLTELNGFQLRSDRHWLAQQLGVAPADSISRIVFWPRDSADLLQAADEVLLPFELLRRGFFITSGAEEQRDLASLLAAFTVNIGVMVLMAFLISGLVLFASMRLRAARYASDFGTLRTLGVPRHWLFLLVLSEGAAIAVIGSLLGVLAGGPLHRVISQLFLETASSLYLGGATVAQGELLSTEMVSLAIGFGVLLGLGGSISPALLAARVSPSLVQRAGSAADLPTNTRWCSAAILSAMALLLAAMLVWQALSSGVDLVAHLAAIFLVVGIGAGAVAVLQQAIPSTRLVFRRLSSAPGLFASSVIGSQLRLMRLPCAVIALSVALLVGLSVMVRSFRETLAQWSDRSVQADLYVRIGDERGMAGFEPLPLERIASLRAVAGVAEVVRFSRARSVFRGMPVQLLGADRALLHQRIPYLFRGGGGCSAAELASSDTVVASEAAARRFNLRAGDRIELYQRSFTVCGVIQDFAAQSPVFQLSFEALAQALGEERVFSFNVFVADGASVADVGSELRHRLGAQGIVVEAAELRGKILETFDETFRITEVMRWLVVMLQIVCVLGAFVQLRIEREEEFSLFATLGAGASELTVAAWHAVLILALPAITVGLLGGDLLGRLLVFVLNPLSFGWSLEWHVAASDYLLPVFVGVGAISALLLPIAYLSQRRSLQAGGRFVHEDA